MGLKIFFIVFVLWLKLPAQNGKMLAIIPFNPDMFNNEGAREMLLNSKMKYDDMVSFFSNELIRYLSDELKKYTETYPLNNKTLTTQGDDNLFAIWSVQNYLLSEIPESTTSTITPPSKLAGKQKNKKFHEEINGNVDELKHKFLDSKIIDKQTFLSISRNLKANKFLIINEFDIKEDYTNPYEVGKNDYRRQIQIHYTLFDAKGQKITGNVAVINFSSKENNIKTIAEIYFPILGKKIKDFILSYL